MPSRKPADMCGRSASSGGSSQPRWTPAALATTAISARSFTRTGTGKAATRDWVNGSTSLGEPSFQRTCNIIAPPRTAARQTAIVSRPLSRTGSVITIKRNCSTSAMTKILRGLRGATTATANTSDAILEATEELLAALQKANGFEPADVESAIFTSSPDLTAEYPARAARRLGWTGVPLLGAAGVPVPGRVPGCFRILLHFFTAKADRSVEHLYLRA